MLMLKKTKVLGDIPDSKVASVPKVVLLNAGTTVFGRDHVACDVFINSKKNLMISRCHATIKADTEKYVLTAHGQNGVVVNGIKVDKVELKDGDEVVFGGAGVRTRVGKPVQPASELVYRFVTNVASEGGVATPATPATPDCTGADATLPLVPSKAKLDHQQTVTLDAGETSLQRAGSGQQPPTQSNPKDMLADMHEELLCCICRELMVRAHTLSCSHTFCKECITDWMNSQASGKDTCPSCRESILAPPMPVIVLDNTIDLLASKILDPEELAARKQRVQAAADAGLAERQPSRPSKRSRPASAVPGGVMGEVIEMITISDDEDAVFWTLEYARNQAGLTCRTCRNGIARGSLRWVEHIAQPGVPYPLVHWHHYECVNPEFSWTTDNIGGLTDTDQERVRSTFPEQRVGRPR